jgi:hypothetical protein
MGVLSVVAAVVLVLSAKCGPPDRYVTGDPCPTCGETLLPHGRYPYDLLVCRACKCQVERA